MLPDLALIPDDCRLEIEREFDAPRELVWKMFADPYHLSRWWGPKGFTNPVVELDFRVGGRWHHVMRGPDGRDYPADSEFIEIVPPERLVWRDAPDAYRFGDELPPPQMVTEMTLSEEVGRTTIEVTVRFTSVAARDEAIARGFATTVLEGSEKLDVYLPTIAAGAAGN